MHYSVGDIVELRQDHNDKDPPKYKIINIEDDVITIRPIANEEDDSDDVDVNESMIWRGQPNHTTPMIPILVMLGLLALMQGPRLIQAFRGGGAIVLPVLAVAMVAGQRADQFPALPDVEDPQAGGGGI